MQQHSDIAALLVVLVIVLLGKTSASLQPRQQNILITGGAGFIGFHTAVKLTEEVDAKVVVLDIFDDSYSVDLKKARAGLLKEKGIIVHTGDICSVQMLDYLIEEYGITKVVHLAGKEGGADSMNDLTGYLKANTQCLLVLLERIKQIKDVHLVYTSSYSVYGDQDHSPVSVKSVLPPPISVYGALKVGLEELVASYSYQFNLSAVGLRLFSVYGPWGRPDGDIYRIVSQLDQGHDEVEIYTSYRSGMIHVASRDYTYIDDVVRGILAALSYKPKSYNDVFNIGSGKGTVSMETIVTIIEKYATKELHKKFVDLPLWEPLVTNADITLTSEVLGVTPQTTINEGIELFFKWYKDYHHEKKWSSFVTDPETKLQEKLKSEYVNYHNRKYHEQMAQMRLKYEEYALKNKIPVTKFYWPKTFLAFKNKKPVTHSQANHKDKSVEELRTLCQDIPECLAFTTDGHLYSHIGQERNWIRSGGTLYVADIDICKAGMITCFGNCTCKYTGPGQAELGCAKGFGRSQDGAAMLCSELYVPGKSTSIEEDFKVNDKMENLDWYKMIEGKEFVKFSKRGSGGHVVAIYPDAKGDVDKLKEACDNTYHCVAFSTNGELKSMLLARKWGSSQDDLYVRDIDPCKLGYRNCKCKRIGPAKYQYNCAK